MPSLQMLIQHNPSSEWHFQSSAAKYFHLQAAVVVEYNCLHLMTYLLMTCLLMTSLLMLYLRMTCLLMLCPLMTYLLMTCQSFLQFVDFPVFQYNQDPSSCSHCQLFLELSPIKYPLIRLYRSHHYCQPSVRLDQSGLPGYFRHKHKYSNFAACSVDP